MMNQIRRRFFGRLIVGLFAAAVFFCLNNDLLFAEVESFYKPLADAQFEGVGRVVVADMNQDGQKEIFFGTSKGKLYGMDSSGNYLTNFPINLFTLANPPPFSSLDNSIDDTPAIADVDGDGRQEIIVCVAFTRPTNQRENRLFVLSADGTVFPKWPSTGVSFPVTTFGSKITGMPVTWDFDSDGNQEIIITVMTYGNPNVTKLYIFKNDGTSLNSSFPKTLPFVQPGVLPAIGDLNGDGIADIVIVSNTNQLYVVSSSDGSNLPGWPITVQSTRTTVALGDVDNDGFLNVVITEEQAFPPRVSVFNQNGSELAGWPRTVSGSAYSFSSPSLADLDGDQRLEIIFESEAKINVLRSDGTVFPGWPQSISPDFVYVPNRNVVIADLDGDSHNDIIFLRLSPATLYVWDRNGNLLPGFPTNVPNPGNVDFDAADSPVVTDLKDDGDTDIVMSLSGVGFPFIPAVLTIGDFGVYDSNAPWPQFHRNPQHTGLFNKYSLKVGIMGDGNVMQTPLPDSFGSYQSGQAVQLQAIPNSAGGWLFRGWRGDLTGNSNPATIVMNASKSVTTVFRRRILEALSSIAE